MNRSLSFVLVILSLTLLGCSAPTEVRVADDMADAELARYVENTDAIFDGLVVARQTEQKEFVDYKAKILLDGFTDENGKIDRAKVDEIIATRDKLYAEMGAEVQRALEALAKAKVSLRHYHDLKSAVRYYLQKEGLDAGAASELTSLILKTAGPVGE